MNIDKRLRAQWTESARAWIETDQVERALVLDPWMLDALGDVSGKKVIDIGCGEGRFCRVLSGHGAAVTGVDLTEPLIQRARASGGEGETYLAGDAEDLSGVPDASFDLAVSYIVLVDLLDYRRSIREAYRVLRPGGRFVVCNVHPIRSAPIRGGWMEPDGEKRFYLLDDYADEGPREFPWLGRQFVNMHRTLSSYISAFLDAGFALEALHEPTASDAALAKRPGFFEDDFRAPAFIIFVLKKSRAEE